MTGAASWPPVRAAGVPVVTYGESEDADLRIREIERGFLLLVDGEWSFECRGERFEGKQAAG